jgi:pimeloyl-ACP methyl ester carboxylesterase
MTATAAPSTDNAALSETTPLDEFSTGSVTSADGTTIGYLKAGRGPSLVVLPGAMVSARSFTQLASALAHEHTVYVPDRRGRGLSGPFGQDHRMQTEVEDLSAVLAAADATDVAAISVGALIALRAALSHPAVRRLALYEPALSVDGSFLPSLTRFDREIAEGHVAAALITGMLEAKIAPPAFDAMPREQLVAMTAQALEVEDRSAKPGEVTMRMLAPTLHYDLALIREMDGTLDEYRAVKAEVLLLGGSESPAWTRVALDALARVLPHASRAAFAGLDHGGVTDPTESGRGSDPVRVADVMLRFFAKSTRTS